MKAVVRLLLCLVMVSSAHGAEAQWFYVGKSKNFVAFIDLSSKRRQGDIVAARNVFNYTKLTTTEDGLQKYRSVLGYSLYDCELNRSSIISIQFYDENFARGDRVNFYSFKNAQWRDIQENSIQSSVFEAACNAVPEVEVF